MNMTRKDYEIIADAIKNSHEGEGSSRVIAMRIANKLSSHMKEGNPNFNKDKFMKACGF
jgi:hypothetical protein